MDAEVDPAESDRHDETAREGHHGNLDAPAAEPEHQQIGEHAVAQEGANRVAAREAEAEVAQECGGVWRTGTADRDLEYLLQ